MSIKPRSTTYAGFDDPSWLGSGHGLDSTESATLLVSAFTEGTHYPNGYIPGGTPVGKITASGKYGPYSDAAVDGRQTLVGHVAHARAIDGQTDLVVGLFVHGTVVEANLPIAIDAAAKADVAGRIRYV